MDHMPLDGPNGGQQCEYNAINVYDFIISKIPWFLRGAVRSTFPDGSLIIIPTRNPFSSTPTNTTICDMHDG